MSSHSFHLASASPRRRQLLGALGYEFTHGGVDIDESVLPDESPSDMVLRLAVAKAQAALDGKPGAATVLGADTAVVLDETVFGKPASKEDALSMLSRLSGRCHTVLTGVAVLSDGVVHTAISETEVQFREIGPDEAEAYWQSGEAAGKAGAYAVQGLAGIFVRSVNGSYSGVVGLPVYETAQLLRRVGIVPKGMPAHE